MAEIGGEFRLLKTTGTHADILAAVGLADVLAEALGSDEAVTLQDEGPAFLVRTREVVTDAHILGLPAHAGYPFLKTSGPLAPGCDDALDYAIEKERFDRWRN